MNNNLSDVLDRVQAYLKVQQLETKRSSTRDLLKLYLKGGGVIYVDRDEVNYHLAGEYHVTKLRIRLELDVIYDSSISNNFTLDYIKTACQLVDDLKVNFGTSHIYTKLTEQQLDDAKLILTFPKAKRRLLLQGGLYSMVVQQPDHGQVSTYFHTPDHCTYYLSVFDKDTFKVEQYTI